MNLCLCFRLGTAPRILTKHPKIPISLMREVPIPLVIYLEDLLIMWGGGQWKKWFWEGHSYLHTSKPEFCNEQREILHDTKKSNGILGIHHKLGDHDNLPPIKEKELKSIESRRWYRRNIKWYNIKILFDVIPISNGSC